MQTYNFIVNLTSPEKLDIYRAKSILQQIIDVGIADACDTAEDDENEASDDVLLIAHEDFQVNVSQLIP